MIPHCAGPEVMAVRGFITGRRAELLTWLRDELEKLPSWLASRLDEPPSGGLSVLFHIAGDRAMRVHRNNTNKK